MQTSVFDAQTSVEDTLPIEPAHAEPREPGVLPANLAHAQLFWQRYRVLFASFSAAVNALQEEQSRILSREDLANFVVPHPGTAPLDDFCDRLVSKAVETAEEQFAAPASRLEIDRHEIYALPCAQPEGFDLEAIWLFLKRKYETDKGQTASYRLASRRLQQSLELHPNSDQRERDQEVRVVGGRAILTLPLYGKNWRYNDLARDSVRQFLEALKCVAIWGQLWNQDDGARVQEIERRICDDRGDDPRGLGRIDSWKLVTIVPFKGHFEFRLAWPLAEQLHVYQSLYAAPAD